MKTIKLVRKSAPKEWKGDGYKLLLYGESNNEIGAIMHNARKESPNLTLVDDNGFELENDNGDGFECKLYTSEQDSSYQGTVFFDSTGKCTGGKFDNKNSGGSVPGFKQTQRPVVREPLIKQSPKEPQSESQQPAAKKEQSTTQGENRPIFNLGNSGSSASSNNAEKTPNEIDFIEESEKSKEKTENTASDSNSSNSNASDTVSTEENKKQEEKGITSEGDANTQVSGQKEIIFRRKYYMMFNMWLADESDDKYVLSMDGKNPVLSAYEILFKIVKDNLVKLYSYSSKSMVGELKGGVCRIKGEGDKDLGTITFNSSGAIDKVNLNEPVDDEGRTEFYDSVKKLLGGGQEFYTKIKECYGSMSRLSECEDIKKILEGKGLSSKSCEYGKFADAIEEYIKEGKNGTQEEKPAQPDGETKSSPSGASAQSSNQGEIIFKELDNGTFWYSDDGTKQIAVNCGYLRTKKFGWDIDYTMLYKMVEDEIIKLYDNGGKTTNGVCKIEGKGDKVLGTITFNNGDVSSHTLGNPTEDGKGKFYDSVKKLLGDKDFKDKLVAYDGSLHYMAKNTKIISDILKNAGEDPSSYNYGEFADAIEGYVEVEKARNEALKDLYTRLGLESPEETTIGKFDATDFAEKLLGSKSKTLTKVGHKLKKLDGDKEKQIDLLTRLLMRMKRNEERAEEKKKFEEEHKFGKIRYALFGPKSKDGADPKIKKCFEDLGKYIVKNYKKEGKKKKGAIRTEAANKIKLSKDNYPWADTLKGNLKNENLMGKCITLPGKQESKGYEECKLVMGAIFASMAGIEKSEDIICACDALKKGGIKSSEKGTFLGDATQIRKSIKALCGRDNVKPAARKVVIKKLLVTDYQFIRDASSCNELFPAEPEPESKTSK